MDERINEYIQQQSCANICCVDNTSLPYCFSVFYAFNSHEKLLYYKSTSNTQHSKIIAANPAIAGTILPDKISKLQVKGLQFEGMVLPLEHSLAKNAAGFYYKKNPVAVAIPGEIWTIQIDFIKFTDSRLGFGKKLTWNRKEQEAVV